MISVYTSLFNYSPDKFDLEGAISNWAKYANEIVIATFEDQKSKILEATKYLGWLNGRKKTTKHPKIKVVVEKDTSLDDPLFDGKLKNAALQACSNEVVIQQDMDERIGGDRIFWIDNAKRLLSVGFPISYYIPVIDLYKDLDHYKDINAKWYLHTKTGTKRGVVHFAKREDGSVDINKSDTCELINENGDLIAATPDYRFKETLNPKFPHIVHLGYLDLNKRIENNKFWQPVWSARDKSEVKVPTDLETLEKENQAKPHGLKKEWWK